MKDAREVAHAIRSTGDLMGRAVVLAAAAILLLADPAESTVAHPTTAGAPADTLGVENPIHFRKTVLFTPEYLARVAEAASRKRGEERAEVKKKTLGEFARRYQISPELAGTIHDIALAEGIDPDLAFRLVRVESRFNPRARGPAGALGLAQLMPSTARGLDRSLRTEAQIMEPATNLRLGFSYLRRLIERYDGDVRLGLLAYNRGEGTVDRVLRTGKDPENGYSRKVLGTREADAYSGRGLID